MWCTSFICFYCKLSTVVLAGDFNAQLDTEPRCIPNQKSKLLSAFVQRNGLLSVQSVSNSNAFTYVPNQTRIDHVLTGRDSSNIFTKYSVADSQNILTSDHLSIFFQINYGGEINRANSRPIDIKNVNWSKCINRANLRPMDIKNVNWSKCNNFHLSK